MNRTTNIDRKTSILDTALAMVRNIGFESVSIASLAKEVGMSKSGLFAHFNSKEKMHLMILEHAANQFSQEVYQKSLSAKRGLPRLKTIIKNWKEWYHENGGGTCPFLAAAVEYDTRLGVVKDAVVSYTNLLIQSLTVSLRHCVEEGDFSSDTDLDQLAFELYSLIVGHLIYLRTMESKSANKLFQHSLNNLIEKHR